MPDLLSHARALPERTFAAGETLLDEGQRSAGAIFVLVAGEVEILKNGVQVNTVADPGAVFGEMALLLDGSYTATVRAVTETRCRVAADGRAFLETTPGAMTTVARLLARRLELALHYLVDLARQFEGQPASLQMIHDVVQTLGHHQESDAACEPGSDREREPNY